MRESGYDLRFALEPKPNEPRGDILLPTVGHALAFINELEWPEMVGLNPEFAHETMSGLAFSHAVAQTLWHGKLFHIDLNAQRIGKFDQDFRFGSEGIRDAFYTVKVLEDAQWDGMRHFDAHAYRTEDGDGVWDFARGCMRTYLILRDKVETFPPGRRDRRCAQDGGTWRDQRAHLDRGRPLGPSRVAFGWRPVIEEETAGRQGLRPRAPRPAGHRASPRRAVTVGGGSLRVTVRSAVCVGPSTGRTSRQIRHPAVRFGGSRRPAETARCATGELRPRTGDL